MISNLYYDWALHVWFLIYISEKWMWMTTTGTALLLLLLKKKHKNMKYLYCDHIYKYIYI